MKTILLLLGLTALSANALASSEAAWAAYDKSVLASCLKASQLKGTQAIGSPAQFDDQVGYTALLLQGRYPQPHMKNQSGLELCLYNKQTKRAAVTEWDSVKSLKAR
ncbi:hypothetical protein [Pseudomonas abieticivorans]|uniref:hypothetical protein n=1 Tax=Pseudomonas abieticivorans TaxID=2931382 RepID=UPI0020BE3A6B|nr:hypothetical protein [Pseudomonas sp. PIA16]